MSTYKTTYRVWVNYVLGYVLKCVCYAYRTVDSLRFKIQWQRHIDEPDYDIDGELREWSNNMGEMLGCPRTTVNTPRGEDI